MIKITNIIILALCLLFAGLNVMGAENQLGFQQLAREVQQAYERIQDLEMDFIQVTYVQILEKKVRKSGRVRFKKPGMFSIQYEGRRGRQYYSDGKMLWIYQTGDGQVKVFTVDDERVPAEALSFLGGLGNLKKDFAVESVDPKKWEHLGAKKDNLGWLELTPLKKRSQISWLVMGFDPQTHLAQEVYLHTDSGNLSHYSFSAHKANQGIADGAFIFSKDGVKEVKTK